MKARLALLAITALVGAGVGCVGPAPEKTGKVTQAALDNCAVSPEGALCDDGRPCTISDRCVGSICVGTVAPNGTPCTDGDVCTITDVCMAGVCMGTVAPDNNPCTDGDPCTEPDMCKAGKCQAGAPKICSDGNICTTDLCVPTVGCMAVPIPECVVPVDAGDAAEASPDLDAGGPDVPNDVPPVDVPPVDVPSVDVPPVDVPPPVDVMMEMAGDMSLPETAEVSPEVSMDTVDVGETVEVSVDVPDDAPIDAGDDAPVDGTEDASDDAPVIPVDAPDAGPNEDAGSDASEDMGEDPPDLRARGGACVCAAGDGPAAPGYLLAALLVVTAGWRRRPARRR